MYNAYVDAAGTIPAKEGDRVALVKDRMTGNSIWFQNQLAYRPTYQGGSVLDFSGDEYMTKNSREYQTVLVLKNDIEDALEALLHNDVNKATGILYLSKSATNWMEE